MDALLGKGPRRGPIGFFIGAYSVVWGLTRIAEDGKLRRLAAVPFGLTVLFYLGALMALFFGSDDLLGLLWARPEDGGWLAVWWMTVVLLIGASLLVLVLLFTTVAEVVGGFFYDRMAIRILHSHGISTHDPSFLEGTVLDVGRSLLFVFMVLGFSLVGLIPLLGVPFVVLATVVAWLGFASGAVNPALLVTGHRLKDRLRWLGEHRACALGMGAVVATAMLMPFLGLLAIPASIVGASELHARDLLRHEDRRVVRRP